MIRFGRIGITRPEHFPKMFRMYEPTNRTTPRGRALIGDPVYKGTVRCILSIATPQEQERFHQIGVTVTHTLIQRGAPIAGEQWQFALVKGGREVRHFRVQAVHNKGEMDIDTVYYCEERGDLSESRENWKNNFT